MDDEEYPMENVKTLPTMVLPPNRTNYVGLDVCVNPSDPNEFDVPTNITCRNELEEDAFAPVIMTVRMKFFSSFFKIMEAGLILRGFVT